MGKNHFDSLCLAISATFLLVLAGCAARGQSDFAAGVRAEQVQDYDAALVHFEQALRSNPTNVEYKLRKLRAQFEAGQYHVDQGEKALMEGELNLALAEFRRAQSIDPSNPAADQGVKRALKRIVEARAQHVPKTKSPSNSTMLPSGPPKLKPLSCESINLSMSNDARVVFDTIAKLAGLSVVFDPSFTSHRVSIALSHVTLEQALDAVAAESDAFWKPMTSSVILVASNNLQKRRELENEEVGTFYLSNTDTPQDLTAIVGALRQLLQLQRVQQDNADNAIVIRDTPAKLALAQRIIHDMDQAAPEVLLQVSILQTNLNRLHDLGILPGQSTALTFTPRSALQPSSGSNSSDCGTSSATSSCTQLSLNNLKHLSSADYSITLPGAAANAILTDSATHIIQNPEIRVTDGQQATLKIGDRVPVATGSFSAASSSVSPLVNTQFQYIDVGVNLDVTARVHPNNEISLKLKVDVSSVTGTQSIGGIEEPIISQRTVDHEVRLKDGEVSILGGLWQQTESNTVNGWPGLSKIPFLRYFFSDNKKELEEDEVLIVLTPHIVRFPDITPADLRWVAAGTENGSSPFHLGGDPVRGCSDDPVFSSAKTGQIPNEPASAATLRFDPSTLPMKAGGTATIGLSVANVHDLYSIPLILSYNPAVIRVEDVRDGGFLSGGTQTVAIVQHIDQGKGQVVLSAMRPPNTHGVNGSGTLFGIVIRAVAPGTSSLRILDVGARNSRQGSINLKSQQATIRVQ